MHGSLYISEYENILWSDVEFVIYSLQHWHSDFTVQDHKS
jgi:hypothetical protein